LIDCDYALASSSYDFFCCFDLGSDFDCGAFDYYLVPYRPRQHPLVGRDLG
jgi:hypothetical protein